MKRLGRVATLDEDSVIVEVLETTAGLGIKDTVVSILGEPVCFDVGPNMLGRVFDSVGRPLDGGTPIPAMRRMRVDGMTIKRVEIDGLRTINEGFVRRIIRTRAGQNYVRRQVQDDVRELP